MIKSLFLSLFLFAQYHSFCQTLKSEITSAIESKISIDSRSWKASDFISGTVEITEANVNSNSIDLKGTFKVRVRTVLIKSTETIYFTGSAKNILDELSIKCLKWTQPYLGSTYTIGDCN